MTEFTCPKGHIPKANDILNMNGYCPECGMKIFTPTGESASIRRREERQAAVQEYNRRKET